MFDLWGIGAAGAAYIMFRIWGSSSDCIASRVENGDKTPSAAQWILFSNETLTPIWRSTSASPVAVSSNGTRRVHAKEWVACGGSWTQLLLVLLQFSFIMKLFRLALHERSVLCLNWLCLRRSSLETELIKKRTQRGWTLAPERIKEVGVLLKTASAPGSINKAQNNLAPWI